MAPARAAVSPDQEGTFSMGSSHTLDQLDICFDATHAVANAGLPLAATLAQRLGVGGGAGWVCIDTRHFAFGHGHQLDRLTEQILTRGWAAGAGPGDGPMTIDLDSTVCEVHGDHKQGAAYGSHPHP